MYHLQIGDMNFFFDNCALVLDLPRVMSIEVSYSGWEVH